MKLQINQRGSWRDIVEFEPSHLTHIQAAVIPLAREIGEWAKWRVTKDSRTAIAYLKAPGFNWSKR